ncbi:hypothetical protein ACH47C_20875 [Streptomyces rishiriensis]|uniref:hypothetical protein n=1 Tax=Streptomyces rishiriensis TaxID=68264 RepID=UPI0033FE1B40
MPAPSPIAGHTGNVPPYAKPCPAKYVSAQTLIPSPPHIGQDAAPRSPASGRTRASATATPRSSGDSARTTPARTAPSTSSHGNRSTHQAAEP